YAADFCVLKQDWRVEKKRAFPARQGYLGDAQVRCLRYRSCIWNWSKGFVDQILDRSRLDDMIMIGDHEVIERSARTCVLYEHLEWNPVLTERRYSCLCCNKLCERGSGIHDL